MRELGEDGVVFLMERINGNFLCFMDYFGFFLWEYMLFVIFRVRRDRLRLISGFFR